LTHAYARATAISVVSLLATAGAAHGSGNGSGGAAMPGAPKLRVVKCMSSADLACASRSRLVRGGTARLGGSGLDQAAKVVFLGRRTRRDDASVRVRRARANRVDVVVPVKARTGRVMVVDKLGRRVTTRRSYRIGRAPAIDVAPGSGFFFGGRRKPTVAFTARATAPLTIEVVRPGDGAVLTSFVHNAVAGSNTATWDGKVGSRSAPSGAYEFRIGGVATASQTGRTFAMYDHLFPIRGRHTLGETETQRFGGGRGHQGVDNFARCGTRLAAARGGKVQYAGYHGRAGNYLVIDGDGTGVDYAYMHLRKPPLVSAGQRVFTGQKIGEVGDTGRASGCHLHFEMWTAPGWYEGGKPFDPLPSLQRWDAYS
jgi:murein DD-endopeptidase MepM/ murein hydrolase activator NlpD